MTRQFNAGASGPRQERPAPGGDRGPSARALCEAARRFAESVATSDATFVRSYLFALNTCTDLGPEPAGRPVGLMPRSISIPSATLFSNSTYAASARALYSHAEAARILGWRPPEAMHRECVAIRCGAAHCAGVLVARNIVATTAACSVSQGDFHVIIGGKRGETIERTVHVMRVIPHPRYDPETNENDIAALMLEEETDLPYARIAGRDTIDNATELRVVGFGGADNPDAGRPRVKYAIHLPIASVACTCDGDREAFRCHHRTELVAGKPALARDSCSGESGTPCYVRSGSRWLLAGITSRPIPGYHFPCGDGTIFVRIDHHADWLRSIPKGRW